MILFICLNLLRGPACCVTACCAGSFSPLFFFSALNATSPCSCLPGGAPVRRAVSATPCAVSVSFPTTCLCLFPNLHGSADQRFFSVARYPSWIYNCSHRRYMLCLVDFACNVEQKCIPEPCELSATHPIFSEFNANSLKHVQILSL